MHAKTKNLRGLISRRSSTWFDPSPGGRQRRTPFAHRRFLHAMGKGHDLSQDLFGPASSKEHQDTGMGRVPGCRSTDKRSRWPISSRHGRRDFPLRGQGVSADVATEREWDRFNAQQRG